MNIKLINSEFKPNRLTHVTPEGMLNTGSAERAPNAPKAPEVQKPVDFAKQEIDLKVFQAERKLLNDNKEAKDKFKTNLDDWDKKRDIESMRLAGNNQMTEQEFMTRYRERSTKLSATFLDRDPQTPNSYKVDFHGNETAEWKVGMGDMFPPEVFKILIERADGSTVTAVRGWSKEKHRIGYFDEEVMRTNPQNLDSAYGYVHTGDKVTILETRQIPNGDKILKDEYEQLYKNGGAKDSASMPPERFPSTVPEYVDPIHALTGAQTRDLRERVSQSPLVHPAEAKDLNPDMARLVSTARDYASKTRSTHGNPIFDPDWQNVPDLQNGKLGCAWVACRILKDSGVVDRQIGSVEAVRDHLLQKGWTTVSGNSAPEPGYVAIWEKGGRHSMAEKDSELTGHRHIGIVVDSEHTVDNSSAQGGPLVRPLRGRTGYFNQPRAIECFLKPPQSPRQTAPNNAPPASVAAGSPDIGRRSPTVGREHAGEVPYENIIREAAQRYGLRSEMVKAVIQQESNFVPDIANNTNSGGLMALQKATAEHYGLHTLPLLTIPRTAIYFTGIKLQPGDDRADPEKCIDVGCHLLKDLLAKYQKYEDAEVLAFAAYNSGPTRIDRWLKSGRTSPLPAETLNYMRQVPQRIARFEAASGDRNSRAA